MKIKKSNKIIKASILIFLLLFGVITVIAPTTSAGTFISLNSYVDVIWAANETQKPVIPRGEMRQLDLELRYQVTTGGIAAQMVFMIYQGRQVNIKMEVIDTPSWCTANLKSGTLTTTISSFEKELSTVLTLRIEDDAPAYGAGFVKIKATVPKIGVIDGFNQEFTLEFTPAYLPMISAQLPEGNSNKIGPMDTASFPIEVTNLGNARTRVFFEIEYMPKGWIAVITDDITLDESQGSQGTAYLTIKPPKSFGYHYDEESIRVKMTPARAEDIQNRGESSYVTVIVESRGFSLLGFEVVLLLIGIILIGVLIYIFKKKKFQ
jgi:hypothetical protein